jgi:hypothetical protein
VQGSGEKKPESDDLRQRRNAEIGRSAAAQGVRGGPQKRGERRAEKPGTRATRPRRSARIKKKKVSAWCSPTAHRPPTSRLSAAVPHADADLELTQDTRRAFGSRRVLALCPFPIPADFVCIRLAFFRWPKADSKCWGSVRTNYFQPALFRCSFTQSLLGRQ